MQPEKLVNLLQCGSPGRKYGIQAYWILKFLADSNHSIVSLKYLVPPRLCHMRTDTFEVFSVPKFLDLKFFMDDSLLDVCPLMTGGKMFQKWMHNIPLLKLFNSHPLPHWTAQ